MTVNSRSVDRCVLPQNIPLTTHDFISSVEPKSGTLHKHSCRTDSSRDAREILLGLGLFAMMYVDVMLQNVMYKV